MLGVLRSVLWSALGTGTWAACRDSCKVQAGPVCRRADLAPCQPTEAGCKERRQIALRCTVMK